MACILITTHGTTGDLFPFLALGVAAARRDIESIL